MARLTPLSLADARCIGARFGLEVRKIEEVDGGSVNSNFVLTLEDSQRVFLRIYEEQDAEGANAELRLVRELAQAGVPTPAPLATKDGESLGEQAGKPVALFPWVPGEMLCQARVSPEAARRVGQALAQVHTAPISEVGEGRFRVEDLFGRLDTVEAAGSAELRLTATELRSQLERCVAARDPELPSGVIHGDLFRDNVLWREDRIAALIDFESASSGVFTYDLMVTVLAWCYRSQFDAGLVEALLAGYCSRRPLTTRELDALEVEGMLGCLRFAVTRITDYSMRAAPGQPPLRDYRRFLARLQEIEAGALRAVVASLRP